MFYSAKTKGFYSVEFHGDSIPEDVVEITAEEHIALIEGESSGKVILSDASGKPYLADKLVSEAQVTASNNFEAKQYLASTDWYVIRLQETGQAIPEDILAARKAARASIK